MATSKNKTKGGEKLSTRPQRKQANNLPAKTTLGIITGGGDCPGLNAAIRAVVRRAAQEGVSCVGILHGFQGLYEGQVRPLALREVSGILQQGGTILGTSRFNPLAKPDSVSRIARTLKKYKIHRLLTIGGEGTMRCAHELEKLGFPCLGIPKTIDNDVAETDFTFGFDTAVTIATEALDRLHTTAESHNRVMLLEVMGRHTGWIATYTGMAGGADAILIPEQEFPLSRLLKIIETRRSLGKNFSLIVVSEDAKILLDVGRKKPELLRTPMHQDEYGHLKLGGIATFLEQELRLHLNMEVRTTILGYLQRGGIPTAHDRILATRLGVAAAQWALQGRSGIMAALRGNEIKPVLFSKVIQKLKQVDPKIYEVAASFFDA